MREFALEQKRERDAQTLAAYEKKLRNTKKRISQGAEATSETGRRNKALALGEVLLKLIDSLQKENGTRKLIPGTLTWQVSVENILLPNGKKGCRHIAAYSVGVDEAALTEEEILKELEETRALIEEETEEMFRGDDGEESAAEADAAGEGTQEEDAAETDGEPVQEAPPWTE